MTEMMWLSWFKVRLTFKIWVITVFVESTRSKVNDLDVSSAGVHKNIFIFYVPVYNPPGVTELQCLNYLPQKPAKQATNVRPCHWLPKLKILACQMENQTPWQSNKNSTVPLGNVLFQTSSLCDEVEEVLAGLWPLKDDKKPTSWQLKPIQHLNDPTMSFGWAWPTPQTQKQSNLHGDTVWFIRL